MDFTLKKILNSAFSEKRKNKTYSKFSDTSTAGSYDFLSQIIQLNSIEKYHIDELKKYSHSSNIESYEISKKILPLLAHEQAHWVDNTSTLWGFEFLQKLYESFELAKLEEVNADFHKKKSLYDEIQCINYPKYYSTVGKSTGVTPWKYQYSVGKLFDQSGKPSEYPVFFTRFNDATDKLVSREPFALCALFESSATYQELSTEILLMQSMLSDNEFLLEKSILNKKYLSRVYDKSLTEYSVAAHKISNELTLNDIVEAYGLSASLAHFSLNFFTDYFEKLNPDFIYGENHLFGNALKILFKHKDRAGLYFFLCDAIGSRYKNTPVKIDNIKEVINNILSEFGISLEEMTLKVEGKMLEISKNICAKYNDEYSCKLLSDGVDRFKMTGVMNNGLYPFIDLKAPGAILGDNYYFNPYGYYDLNYENRYLDTWDFLNHLSSFSGACIYKA
jgi:hypothetical protein